MIEGATYHSVTKVLHETMPESSRLFLENWQKKIGIENAEQIRQDSMKRGNVIDENVSCFVATGKCENELLQKHLSGFKIHSIEQDVYSDTHLYKGRYDMLLEDKYGRIIINDNKGSGKKKSKDRLWDYPLQIAAYKYALLEMGVHVDFGMVTVLVDEINAIQSFTFSAIELKECFNRFLIRLNEYRESILLQNNI